MTIYFIVGSARTGSTSLSNILATGENAISVSEAYPTLARESRDYALGRLPDAERLLEETIGARARDALRIKPIYCEKQATLEPFIEDLSRLYDGRFVHIYRDGRDVVRSLINWHEQMYGNIYRECRETSAVSHAALSEAARLPAFMDDSDYCRPRPQKDSHLWESWLTLDRLSMCSWYWNEINSRIMARMQKVPLGNYFSLDYTSPTPEQIAGLFDFMKLSGFDRSRIESLLGARINSNGQRGAAAGTFPHWSNWDGGRRRRFSQFAGTMMEALGFFRGQADDWKPSGYGAFWKTDAQGDDWYRGIFESRLPVHRDLMEWVAAQDSERPISSIADFGCGTGWGYREAFKEIEYLGVDISSLNVETARSIDLNNKHKYMVHDFIASPLPPDMKKDLVFCQGTIDNVYDIEACLHSMIASSRRWIYLTAYRGWFPDLEEHRYSYSAEHGCFYNEISSRRLTEFLVAKGCTDIKVEKLYVGKPGVPFETRVVARVPER